MVIIKDVNTFSISRNEIKERVNIFWKLFVERDILYLPINFDEKYIINSLDELINVLDLLFIRNIDSISVDILTDDFELKEFEIFLERN